MSYERQCDECETTYMFVKKNIKKFTRDVKITRTISDTVVRSKTGMFGNWSHVHVCKEVELLIRKTGSLIVCPICEEENILTIHKEIVVINPLADEQYQCEYPNEDWCQRVQNYTCCVVGDDVTEWMV